MDFSSNKTCYLSIGGNLGNRKQILYNTHELIHRNLGSILSYSPIYMSEPWGFNHRKYFLNQVIKIKTSLSPESLLNKAKQIEKWQGRQEQTQKHYEGRTIDIDIISYEDIIVSNNELQIPHKHIHQRKFVLLPLRDIAPKWTHPKSEQSIDVLIELCNDKSCIRKLKLAPNE
jgi:2-amino-4-hydroxy-6-hydroxymethyldihydropteridine diphosphokinase